MPLWGGGGGRLNSITVAMKKGAKIFEKGRETDFASAPKFTVRFFPVRRGLRVDCRFSRECLQDMHCNVRIAILGNIELRFPGFQILRFPYCDQCTISCVSTILEKKNSRIAP